MADPRKVPKKANKDLKNKKSLRDPEEDSDSSDLSDEEGVFEENDRKLRMAKTEKEREAILYERELMKEDLRKKKKLEKEMKKDERLKQSVETKNQKMKKTLDELSLKRTLEKEKSKRSSERRKYSSGSSPMSSKSSIEEDSKNSDVDMKEESNLAKKEEEGDELHKFWKKNDGIKKKTQSASKPEEKTLELKDIESIRLTRHMIEKMISQPNFEKTAKGCFVRVSVSTEKNKSNYVIAEIKDVLENPKAYKIDIKETRKVLLLRHADKEKKYEISFVSNGKMENSEFVNWNDKMEWKKLPKPTPAQIAQKIQDIKEALNYKYDEEKITEIFKKKVEQKISINSPTSKDLTAEINHFSQRLGTLEFENFESKNPEKARQIKEISEKLMILKEKQKKFSDVSKKRDLFEEARMQLMFGEYLLKKGKSKGKKGAKAQDSGKKTYSPSKNFKTLEEKLQQCASAKEYESIKEEFLQIFQRKFDFEDEIEEWKLEESEII